MPFPREWLSLLRWSSPSPVSGVQIDHSPSAPAEQQNMNASTVHLVEFLHENDLNMQDRHGAVAAEVIRMRHSLSSIEPCLECADG